MLHPHDLVSPVDVNNLTRDRCRTVTGEEYAGLPKLSRIAASSERRMLLVMLEHRREPGNSSGRKCLDRTGADAVDSDFAGTQIVRKIAGGRFETRFRYAHNVIMRHHFSGADIGHRDNASTRCHERSGFPGEPEQRVSAHIVRQKISVTRGV